jgi:uncharacterized RDD family membrane protein YckC
LASSGQPRGSRAPFRRFFARWLDTLMLAPPAITAAFSLLANVPLSILFIVPAFFAFFMIAEAVCLSNFGTTPGKALLALSVRTLSGERLSFRQAFTRTARVFVYGKGLYIPIVTAVTMLLSLRDLSQESATRWDRDRFEVVVGRMTLTRWALLILFLAVCFILAEQFRLSQEALQRLAAEPLTISASVEHSGSDRRAIVTVDEPARSG